MNFVINSMGGCKFTGTEIEITILDRRGHVLWKKKREESLGPIQWDGRDLHGELVHVGHYTCKIVYSDLKTVYAPFVFLKQPKVS
jgi:flagellar hook assembly protein FlgD